MHKIAPVWKWLFIVVLAIAAIAAAFHFDDAVRSWIVEHSNRHTKQLMRYISRYGDWPEHILAGLLVIAVAWWRGSKRWVRVGLTMILACALAGVAVRTPAVREGPPGRGRAPRCGETWSAERACGPHRFRRGW